MKFRGFTFSVQAGLKQEDLDGVTSYSEKEVLIGSHCRGKRELETVIHEALHVMDRNDSEKKVTKDAADLADLLWRWGYRKNS